MPNQNVNLNVSAKTVDEAIELGLTQLGVSRDQVDIEVVSEGKRGIFGIGSEEATVRLIVRKPPEPVVSPPVAQTADVEPEVVEEAEVVEKTPVDPAPADEAAVPESDDSAEPEPDTAEEIVAKSEEKSDIDVAQAYLGDLLRLMGIEAKIETHTAPDLVEPGEVPPTVLDITGKDLGILIGRRSETLQALQYMVRLMASKELGNWQRIVVDVESYRSRRRRSLQKMATRMAERAANNDERVVLEAMTAYERRIIHIALRDHPKVYTRSTGRDNTRKVTIIPK